MRTHAALLTALLALLSAVSLASADTPFRTWKNTEGNSMEARLVERKANRVILEMRNSKRHEIPLARLSAEDIAWLDSQKENAAEPSRPLVPLQDFALPISGENWTSIQGNTCT